MNVDELVRATLRRKVACLVVLLCAVAAGTYGVMSSTDTYESSAVAVVYPPGAGDIDAKLNPFVNLNDNMGQLAAVAATLLQSPAAVALVEEAGASGEYTVTSTLGDTASALRLSPQLMITTSGPTPEAAQAGAQALLDYSSTALAQLQVQTGVRPNTEASITAAVMPEPGALVAASPLKAAGSYALAVLVVGLLGIVTVGTILDRRRPRRDARSAVPVADETIPETIPETTVPEAATPGKAAPPARRATVISASKSVTAHNPRRVAEPAPAQPVRSESVDDASDADDQTVSVGAESRETEADDADTAAFPAQVDVWSAFGNAKAAEPTKTESSSDDAKPERDRVSVRPPGRVHSTAAPKPPDSSSYQDFDPFNVPTPRDPRVVEQRRTDSTDGFPARTTTPVREIEHEIDDYYGVEERVHVPIRSGHHDYPRSSISGGGPRR
ncbi:hypothetical protein [Rhodococcoides kyotonense]|uniref:Capsular polysaccharide biosynthesis protein n=1 Tax=Rhodococcoides kyotonense TaxID=398843 RepID=A0A177YGV6_9NOCA|nr:hypothetical protein [Rhodococcus kyotonensis]OAK54743.1 hypothetical protein A3K89_05255 [Rhodococcus kyotonensis]